MNIERAALKRPGGGLQWSCGQKRYILVSPETWASSQVVLYILAYISLSLCSRGGARGVESCLLISENNLSL